MPLMTHQQPWGIDGYLAPTNDWALKKVKSFWSKIKKENFMETFARKKKEIPGPNKYEFKTEWTGQYSDGGGHSGKWIKAPKVTYIDEILSTKKLKRPGPGQYKYETFKIPNVPIQKTEKGEFINNCRWYGLQTPGWKYKINYVSTAYCKLYRTRFGRRHLWLATTSRSLTMRESRSSGLSA